MEYAIMGLIVLVLVVVLKQPRSIEVHFHNTEEKPEKGELSEEEKQLLKMLSWNGDPDED